MRGRTKEQIIHDLRNLRGHNLDITDPDVTLIQETEPVKQYLVNLDSYWQYHEPLESSLVVIVPSSNETVLEFLGSIPLANDEENATFPAADIVMKYLDSLYKDVSQKAIIAAMNVGE